VEDNLGYVGGFGDLIDARKILLKTFPEIKPAITEDQTFKFYDEMAAHYKSQVAEGEKVVLLFYQKRGSAGASESSDNEDRRMVQLLTKRGIEAVALPGNKGPDPNKKRLEVKGNKVFLVTPPKGRTTSLVEKSVDGEDRPAPNSPAPRERSQPRKPPRPSPSPEVEKGLSPSKKDNEKLDEEPKAKKARTDGAEPEQKEKRERVGLVIFLSEPTDVQAGHASTKLRVAMEVARHRASEYAEEAQEKQLRAQRKDQSITRVSTKLQLKGTDDLKSSLEMKGKILVWTVQDKDGKEVDRLKGPIGWDALNTKLSCKMSDGEKTWSCKLDENHTKLIQKNCEIEEKPVAAVKLAQKSDELTAAVEKIGQLVGGQFNDKAPEELFRLLRVDDKEEWNRVIKTKRGVPNLLDAYYNGGVKIANGPGFELLGDKELCAHVDKLIKFYLKEEPVLQTIPTLSFATDPDLIAKVFDDARAQENVVVKRVDGRGGDAVWVGAKLSRTDFMEARPLVVAEPDAFIVQKYTALSQVDGQLVDLRGPAILSSSQDMLSGGPGVSVSPVLWGRGVLDKGGNGKVNISDSGFEFTIATSVEEKLGKKKDAKVVEESSTTEVKKSTNKYKYIDKVKYERDLLDAAEEFVKDDPKSHIDMKEAKQLWKSAMDGPGVTPTERRTLEHILKNKKFTPAAAKYLQGELSKAGDTPE